MVSNRPGTGIDAPLVAAASAAPIPGRELQPSETVFDVGREAPECRFEGFMRPEISPTSAWRLLRRRSRAEERRRLLLCEIASDTRESFHLPGESPGKRAGIGLGRGRRRPRAATCDEMPRSDVGIPRPRREPAFYGEVDSRRPNRLIDDALVRPRLSIMDVNRGATGRWSRKESTELFSAAGYGFAQRGAGGFDLLGQSLEERFDRLGRPVGDVGGDVA